jgi:hypothetical protein
MEFPRTAIDEVFCYEKETITAMEARLLQVQSNRPKHSRLVMTQRRGCLAVIRLILSERCEYISREQPNQNGSNALAMLLTHRKKRK